MVKLTEKHHNVFIFSQNPVQHSNVDLFDFARNLKCVLIGQPGQHLVLVLQITGEVQWITIAEEVQLWILLDAQLLGIHRVFSCDENDAGLIQLVVNVLQIGQNIVTLVFFLARPGEVHDHVLMPIDQLFQNFIGHLLNGSGALLQA